MLDTTVLVAAERAESSINEVVADEDDVSIAAVTAAELLVGVELAAPEVKARRASFVEAILDAVPVEPYDVRVARTHAALLAHGQRSGRARGAHGVLIAATAIATDRTVVTADLSGFHGLPGLEVRAA